MFNPFKKSKPKPEKTEEKASIEPVSPKTSLSVSTGKGKRLMINAIYQPHLTEKTSAAAAFGWYAFRVDRTLNKPEIKRAVQERYGVTVTSVRVLYRQARDVRLGRIQGKTPGFKKALVKLAEGQALELN